MKIFLSFNLCSKPSYILSSGLRKQVKCLNKNGISTSASIEDKIRIDLQPIMDVNSSRVILSVSGGSDSMAMLHCFAHIRNLHCPQLLIDVIHFNHKLRIESDEEVIQTYSFYHPVFSLAM